MLTENGHRLIILHRIQTGDSYAWKLTTSSHDRVARWRVATSKFIPSELTMFWSQWVLCIGICWISFEDWVARLQYYNTMFCLWRAFKMIMLYQKTKAIDFRKSHSFSGWLAWTFQSSRASCSIETEIVTSVRCAKDWCSHPGPYAQKKPYTWLNTLLSPLWNS